VVGDKTGSGERSAVNDVAIAVPPGRAPILIAAYLSDSAASMSALQAAHADVGRAVADELGAPAGEVTRDRADRSTWGSR
jgi:beta-lactamase class A